MIIALTALSWFWASKVLFSASEALDFVSAALVAATQFCVNRAQEILDEADKGNS